MVRSQGRKLRKTGLILKSFRQTVKKLGVRERPSWKSTWLIFIASSSKKATPAPAQYSLLTTAEVMLRTQAFAPT